MTLATSCAPLQIDDQSHQGEHSNQAQRDAVDILDDVNQVVPTVSKKKTYATNRRGPNHCPREIEEEEAQVGHLEKPG